MRYPIWTEHKARLIERYLYLFVQITKHGTYIDGFAGPQDPDKPDLWSARLVLLKRPYFLRRFFLYELDQAKIPLLERMVEEHLAQLKHEKRPPKRDVEIKSGDCNQLIPSLLESGQIGDKEATFCLLDQRTFECHWSTVEAIAQYRTNGYKIEQFYFMPAAWLDRSIAALGDLTILERWWGREDWPSLRDLNTKARLDLLCTRFESELGYAHVYAYPIFNRDNGGGRVMYHMVHATDHPEAPHLMGRAYNFVIKPWMGEQQVLKFG